MRGRWMLLLLVICLVVHSEATLSKSSKKAEEKKKVPKVEENGTDKLQQEEEEPRETILKTHKEFDTSKGKRDFIKLGYVTPWNGHGYDVAKWTAQKFTHISPTWFQLIPTPIDGEMSCEFKGQHDIDRGWLEDLRRNNSAVKIVPRFIFEAPNVDHFRQFISADTAQLRCVEALVAFLQRNQFEGCVFEFWLQILINTRGAALEYLVEMNELFGKRLRLRGLEYIVPLTPPISKMSSDVNSFLPEHVIPRLFDAIDYLNLMTYDFSDQDIDGNSPIPWILINLRFLLASDSRHASKILIGLNYYGKCKAEHTDTILGDKFIELLSDPSYKLLWDDVTRENYIKSDSSVCFFPTLRSIRERLDLVAEERLAGIGIWELGQGLNYFSSAL